MNIKTFKTDATAYVLMKRYNSNREQKQTLAIYPCKIISVGRKYVKAIIHVSSELGSKFTEFYSHDENDNYLTEKDYVGYTGIEPTRLFLTQKDIINYINDRDLVDWMRMTLNPIRPNKYSKEKLRAARQILEQNEGDPYDIEKLTIGQNVFILKESPRDYEPLWFIEEKSIYRIDQSTVVVQNTPSRSTAYAKTNRPGDEYLVSVGTNDEPTKLFLSLQDVTNYMTVKIYEQKSSFNTKQ